MCILSSEGRDYSVCDVPLDCARGFVWCVEAIHTRHTRARASEPSPHKTQNSVTWAGGACRPLRSLPSRLLAPEHDTRAPEHVSRVPDDFRRALSPLDGRRCPPGALLSLPARDRVDRARPGRRRPPSAARNPPRYSQRSLERSCNMRTPAGDVKWVPQMRTPIDS